MELTEIKEHAGVRQRVVLALLFSATAINYLDRQTLSIIAPILHRQIGLSTIDYSHVVFIFLMGYTLSQTLSGRIIDRIGTRLGMLLCVALWSVVSILHGLVVGVLTLGLLRLMLGLAEAGNWPGGVKAVSENFPAERRAFKEYFSQRAVWGLMIGRFLADPIWWFYAF
jgi:MFS transporter, ACS family, aldohexuronate transporter